MEDSNTQVFFLDFEGSGNKALTGKASGINAKGFLKASDGKRAKVVEGGGIAGTNCLDITGGKVRGCVGPLAFDEPDLLDSLANNWSFTVTGWAKTTFHPPNRTDKCVLNCHGRFKVYYRGRYQGLGALRFEGEPHRYVGTSWFGPLNAEKEEWRFFAFTYDGTRKESNGIVYFGSESDEVSADVNKFGEIGITIPSGQVNLKEAKELLVGAADEEGAEPFDGFLDNIRIFAAKERNGAAALSVEQVEAIRKEDLGEKWLQKVVAEKAAKEHAKWTRRRELREKYFSNTINAIQTDSLSPKFTDIPPEPVTEALHVPRGGTLPLTFAVHSSASSICKIAVSEITGPNGNPLRGQKTIYFLKPVPIEANNNGGIRSAVGVMPPNTWRKYLIREAPFDISEVMIETDHFALVGGGYHTVLLDLVICSDAAAGEYTGAISFESEFNIGGYSTKVPFSFTVYPTIVPSKPPLNVVHWLHPQPENLVYGVEPPEWWSERHWKLLEIAGRQLLAFGNNAVFTPTIDGHFPLILTIRKKDGNYDFDFSKFDRWVEMFLGLGFDYIDGHHIKHMWAEEVNVFNESTGKMEPFFLERPKDDSPWLQWLPIFFDAMYRHLQKKGWIESYRQCLYDEPGSNSEGYRAYADLLHKYMPGVKSKDALGELELHHGLTDIAVPSLRSIECYPDDVARREREGYETELYHCCSPYPPHPNRHLDEPPFGSRLMPWYCYRFNATGYLWWAANLYRGVDPYKGSLGPIGPTSRIPMHPAGDDWFFYPTSDGLIPGYRNILFRDGLLDHTLLTMLATKNRTAADRIMDSIARDTKDYQRDTTSYHQARQALLKELGKWQM